MGGDRHGRPAGEHPQPADTLPVGTPDPTVSRRAYIHQSRNTDAGFPTTTLGDPPPTHEGGSRLLVTPGRGVCDLERLREEIMIKTQENNNVVDDKKEYSKD